MIVVRWISERLVSIMLVTLGCYFPRAESMTHVLAIAIGLIFANFKPPAHERNFVEQSCRSDGDPAMSCSGSCQNVFERGHATSGLQSTLHSEATLPHQCPPCRHFLPSQPTYHRSVSAPRLPNLSGSTVGQAPPCDS